MTKTKLKNTLFQISLGLSIVTFLLGAGVVLMNVWEMSVLSDELFGKIFVTCGIIFVSSVLACIFLYENEHEENLKKNNFIN